ncbi:MAG: dockerin type I domain-containing protein, partial [Phycisphaerales bacterium]
SNGSPSSGAGVRTGVEFRLSLAALGWNGYDPIKVCAFVSGGGFGFVSNQVLGPLPVGTQNLGEPRVLDLSAIPGLQHFTVPNTWQPDRDSDGVSDLADNCLDVFNPSQADCDGDGIGNACDSGGDFNGNGIPDDCECIADLYVDGLVNGVDLGALLAYWGPTTSSSASQRADMNRDGAVDGVDLGYLLSRWGPCGN